ncbi:unnamed protein product [Arctogadus glacialis]
MSHLLHRHHFIINDGSGVHHLKEKSAVAGYRFERQRFEDSVLSCEEEERKWKSSFDDGAERGKGGTSMEQWSTKRMAGLI